MISASTIYESRKQQIAAVRNGATAVATQSAAQQPAERPAERSSTQPQMPNANAVYKYRAECVAAHRRVLDVE